LVVREEFLMGGSKDSFSLSLFYRAQREVFAAFLLTSFCRFSILS